MLSLTSCFDTDYVTADVHAVHGVSPSAHLTYLYYIIFVYTIKIRSCKELIVLFLILDFKKALEPLIYLLIES